MAHGCDCKHCGHQETVHFENAREETFNGILLDMQWREWLGKNFEIDPDKPNPGRKKTLSTCPKFEYRKADMGYVEREEDPHRDGMPHEGQH
jgi:hypothetical protein